MKSLNALTQPLIDIIIPVTHAFLDEHKLSVGSHAVISDEEQINLLKKLSHTKQVISVGGSALNSIITAGTLGIPTYAHGVVGNDHHAQTLKGLLGERRINFISPSPVCGQTGICLSLITPDGERTMRTNTGISKTLCKQHVCEQSIQNSAYLLIEGYLLTASKQSNEAVFHAIDLAKRHQTKIALSLASEFVATAKRAEIIDTILPEIDILIANEHEALALSQVSSLDAILNSLKALCHSAVITRGKHGAVGFHAGSSWQIDAHPPSRKIVDTTGAGDIFAGAFLAGLILSHPPSLAAKGAAKLSSIVITQLGATLPSNTKKHWQRVITHETT